MNYKFNLLHHVGVVAKRVCAAEEPAAHKGADNTPGKKVVSFKFWRPFCFCKFEGEGHQIENVMRQIRIQHTQIT